MNIYTLTSAIIIVLLQFSYSLLSFSQEDNLFVKYNLANSKDSVLIYNISPDTFFSDLVTEFTIEGKNLNSIDFKKILTYLEDNSIPFHLPEFEVISQNDSVMLLQFKSIKEIDYVNLLPKYFKRLTIEKLPIALGEFQPEIQEIDLKKKSYLYYNSGRKVYKKNKNSQEREIINLLINENTFEWDSIILKGKHLIGEINKNGGASYQKRKNENLNRFSFPAKWEKILDYKMIFPNNESFLLPLIIVQSPITPTNGIEWGMFIWCIIIVSVIIFYFFFNDKQLKKSIENLKLPPINFFFSFYIGTIVLEFFFLLVLILVFPTSSSNNAQLVLLTNINLVLIVFWGYLIKQYEDKLNFILNAIPITILMCLITITTPFIIELNHKSLDIYAAFISIEFLIFSFVILLGWSSAKTVQEKLDELKFQGPNLEVLVSLMEERLLQQGSISTSKDYKDLSKEKTSEALLNVYNLKKESWNLSINLEKGTLALNRKDAIKALNENFKKIKEIINLPYVSHEHLDIEINTLGNNLKSFLLFKNGKELLNSMTDGKFSVFSCFSTELESVLPNPFPIIIFVDSNSNFVTQKNNFQSLLNQLDIPSRFTILTSITPSPIPLDVISSTVSIYENIAVVQEQDFYEILASKKNINISLMNKIQQQIDLILFSPYKTKAPTTGDMFYGRKREVGTIVEKVKDASIAILGARRMGKTSVLQSVQRELLNTERKTAFFYLDCYHISTYKAFFREIANRWHIEEINLFEFNQLLDFPWLVAEIQYKLGKDFNIVFQFDEIDRLLKYDNEAGRGEQFFRMLRSLAQEKRCQFIFSGERVILDQLANSKSCFFNFPIPISLDLLNEEISLDLVKTPMKLIGVQLENDYIAQLIFNYTSGHPNLIQYLCEICIEDLSDTESRKITHDLVLIQCKSSSFRETFMETFWSQSSPLERAICLYIANQNKTSKNKILTELYKFGFEPTISDFERGLRYVKLCQIVKIEREIYSIKPHKFKEFLFSSGYPYKMWMRTFLREYRS